MRDHPDPSRYSLVMPHLGTKIMNMDPEERARVMERASSALHDGRAVVLPTDTLYGVFVSARGDGPELLDTITGHPALENQPRMTLHLADPEPAREHLELGSAVGRRLVERLLPGPARLVIEQPEHAIESLRGALGIDPGVIDDGRSVALRVPDHPIARRVIRDSEVPCVARRIGAASWAVGENPGTDLSPLPEAPDPAPEVVIDDGATHYERGSTTVRIDAGGRLEVEQGGALEERDVMANLERTALFVCTGNTCRSPMAEGIARDMLSRGAPDGITTRVASAGITAAEDMPPTDEAVEVMRERGIDISDHRSRALTPAMVDEAEIVYTMTPSHAQSVMTLAPNSVHKVHVLDEREGVPDPVGQDIGVYRETAERLKTLVEQRLKEIRV